MKIAAIRSHRLYKPIMLGIALLIFIIALVNSYYINRENYIDDSSEYVIRGAAAKQIGKNPNELTDEDYVKITKLDFDSLTLTDIKFLRKFTNLKELRLSSIRIPKTKKETTRWSILLAKLGIDYKPKPAENLLIDLSPLKRLKNLEILNLSKTRFKNLTPLGSLINLKELYLSQTVSQSKTQIRDFKPLKRLANLEILSLEVSIISDLTLLKEMKNLEVLNLGKTQIKDFKSLRQLSALKNLHVLYLDNTKIDSLEPIANLTSLQRLVINDNPINSLEPVKGLINLRELVLLDTLVTDIEPVKNLSKLTWIGLPKNITNEQIEDLKKALPDLKIDREP